MRATAITLEFGGEERIFDLPIGQLRDHDELCGAGPAVVCSRLRDGTWRLPDIRETIRLGLIGGGLKPNEASKLVRSYVDERPLGENVLVAFAVLAAVLNGAPKEDDLGEPADPRMPPEMAGSTSAASTELQ